MALSQCESDCDCDCVTVSVTSFMTVSVTVTVFVTVSVHQGLMNSQLFISSLYWLYCEESSHVLQSPVHGLNLRRGEVIYYVVGVMGCDTGEIEERYGQSKVRVVLGVLHGEVDLIQLIEAITE